MRNLVFCCLLASFWSASAQAANSFENAPPFPIPLLNYNELAVADESTSAQLLYTLSNLGIIAISNIPGYKEARIQALSELKNNCLSENGHGASVQTSAVMADGSLRRTAGTSTKSGKPNHLSSSSSNSCDRSTSSLRSLVDLASRALFNSLDLATGRNDLTMATTSFMDTLKGNHYQSLNDLINNAEHLEHFHQYEEQNSNKIIKNLNEGEDSFESSAALRMHIDSGLLIGMTSGYYSSKENNGGLYIELPQGGIYQVVCPDDALIFMVGQGGASWFRPESGLKLRAVPHALVLPWENLENKIENDEHMNQKWRSWYGRMFLPPQDALVPLSGEQMVPFKELRARQIEMVTTYSENAMLEPYASVGCGLGSTHAQSFSSSLKTTPSEIPSWLKQNKGHHRLTTASVETSDDGCGANAVLCWMQCMDSTSLSCGVGTSIACVDEGSGEVVEGDIMCPTGTENCDLQCVADSLLEPPVKHTGFCYGSGTDMYMNGFTSYINNDDTPQCLNLLFTDWTLDNAGKFVAACIGTLLLGIFTEMLGYIRRVIDAFLKRGGFGPNKAAGPLVMSTLYGIQVLMGYFLMLTAMTYQVELFICVIVGLILGHSAFNLQETPTANTDPCCVSRVSQDNKSHQKKHYQGLENSVSSTPIYLGGEKVMLEIDGMTCSSCTNTVQTALDKMRGVIKVNIFLGDSSVPFGGRADIEIEGNETSPQEFINTVESVGFDARLLTV